MLKKLGYCVDVAGNGVEAVQMCTGKSYDIVLMDIQMPIMDGLEATEQIKRRLPKEKQPIIIALTAHALKDEIERCLRVGMWKHLDKPLKVRVLRDVLVAAHAERKK